MWAYFSVFFLLRWQPSLLFARVVVSTDGGHLDDCHGSPHSTFHSGGGYRSACNNRYDTGDMIVVRLDLDTDTVAFGTPCDVLDRRSNRVRSHAGIDDGKPGKDDEEKYAVFRVFFRGGA